jgi:hypothetical protein
MMGPVRSKEVVKAQTEIVAIARKLESEGKIVLKERGRRRICPLVRGIGNVFSPRFRLWSTAIWAGNPISERLG